MVLLNDILDFSKIDAGKLDIEHIEFDLVDLLRKFSRSISHQAEKKGLEVVLDIASLEKDAMVIGDPNRLRQVLANLVGNAIKFTQKGEVIISVRLEKEAPLNGSSDKKHRFMLYGTIKDTGIGIVEDKLKHLFELFSQADTSTTRKYGGTGLGLAISRQLCQLMGGDISATSQVGRGSEFRFKIEVERSHLQQLSIPNISFKQKHVLIVDDNQTNRIVLKDLLMSWGASVTEAVDGESALALLETIYTKGQVVDVAILDMQMPEMDGKELGSRMKTDKRFSQIPLIMMTSVGETGDEQSFVDNGFSAYFSKPVIPSDLHDALSLVLDNDDALQRAESMITPQQLMRFKRPSADDCARLLLVEDNAVNQEVALGLLDVFNVTVSIANNGAEAIEALIAAQHDDAFDLVLMDCQMPVMDGYVATQKIREGAAGEHYKTVPIVAMTANVMQADIDRCLSVGMNDHIGKPVSIERIKHVLAAQLGVNKFHSLDEHPEIEHEQLAAENETPETESIDEGEVDDQSTERPHWDQDDLLRRLRNNEKIIEKLVKMSRDELPLIIGDLKVAIAGGDTKQIVMLAHKLKGSAGNMSCMRLASLAKEIESAGRQNDLANIQSLWLSLDEELKVVFNLFTKWEACRI